MSKTSTTSADENLAQESVPESGIFESGIFKSRNLASWIPESWFEWLRGHQQGILVAAAGFQFVILVVMILVPFQTVFTGDTIRLRVAPVDPRDLFRGDYVILSYEFSRISPHELPELKTSITQGMPVYVRLVREEDQEHWRSAGFSLQKPTSGKFLRGEVTGRNRIEFGIESYFVQEGEGLKYERAVRNGKLSAVVKIDQRGNAVLRRLVIE